MKVETPGGRPVKTLLFSTLYPSSVRPLHGIFVETRLRELLKTGQVMTRVVAPVPWFPSTDARFGDYARIASTPEHETRHGILVDHPSYPLIPKLGLSTAPLFLAAASIAPLRRVLAEGFDFDVIDAHFYYPDGVAAALLGRYFGKPVAVTARGTDLNLYPAHTVPRWWMQWAAHRIEASIGVCGALVDVLRRWSVESDRLHVMRNGVDLVRFHPVPPDEARQRLGQEGAPLLLSVGHLIERKGHHLAIDALARLRSTHPQARLMVVGDGEERQSLHALARRMDLTDAVHFAGAVPNEKLADYYAAADATFLASSREGWANVLLESMACGTPVVATRIWGTPEVVASPQAGVLVDERSGPALAEGVLKLLAAYPARADVRSYAEGFSWAQTSQAQLDLFRSLSRRAANP